MAGQPTSTEARELSLISKVELRIALADSDEKLQPLLQTYLTPLLLKLASEHVTVRNKIISLCQHVNTRIQPLTFELPLAALLKQFKDVDSPLVRHFDLIYIKLALDRLDPVRRAQLLPELVQRVSQLEADEGDAASAFNLILRSLTALKLPLKGSEEDLSFREKLGLSDEDARFLSKWFGKLILLVPAGNKTTCPCLSESEFQFVNKNAPFEETWNSSTSGGLNLAESKIAALKFLACGAFNDGERFIPALIASADANRNISTLGDDILKRLHPDLENDQVVAELFTLFSGAKEPEAVLPARPALQSKILSYLCKSARAVATNDGLKNMLEAGTLSRIGASPTGLESVKLRTQFFNFMNWFARMGPDAPLLAPTIINSLQEYLSAYQGWPNIITKGNTAEQKVRGLNYETIGILGSKIHHDTEEGGKITIKLVDWLFIALSSDTSSDEISASIDQALGSIMNSAAGQLGDASTERLQRVLLHYMKTEPGKKDKRTGFETARSTRYTAIRFANRCIPFSNPEGRWINIMALTSDPDQNVEIVEEGRKGLDPYWFRIMNPPSAIDLAGPSASKAEAFYQLPQVWALMRSVFSVRPSEEENSAKMPPIFTDSYDNAYPATVTFLRNVILCDAFSSAGISFDIDRPQWDERLDAMISTNEDAREAVRKYLKECKPEIVQQFLGACVKPGLVDIRKPLGRTVSYFAEIGALVSNETLNRFGSRMVVAPRKGADAARGKDQDAFAHAFALIESLTCDTNEPQQRLCESLLQKALGWRDAVGKAVDEARGNILMLMYFVTRVSFRGQKELLPVTHVEQLNKILLEIVGDSRDSNLQDTAVMCIGEMALGGLLAPEFLAEETSLEAFMDKILVDAKKGKDPAILSLGRLSLACSHEGSSDLFDRLLKSMYDLHEVRGLEIQLTVGEALSVAAVGWSSRSLLTAFDVDAERPQSNIPAKVLADMLSKFITDCKASKPSLRRASAVWLLSLVQYCGHCQQVQDRLRECQSVFIWLLSDRDEMVQETASRGLSVVYEMGSRDLKDDLVRDLVRSFTAEGSNLGGGKVSSETQLFEPGALPTGDGSVTTYKDIVGLASEVGDPSLVYRFMSLASNNSVWSSRAAFGRFGLSNVLSDSSVNGYLAQNPKIYPKLYRYRFDPNPNVQKSMNDIWTALVQDSNAVINANFGAIMEGLLMDMLTGKEWRVREASCRAIGELVQGRPVQKYEKYLEAILLKAFRLLDDIKASVRQEAFKLCQTFSSILLRALEEGANTKKAQLMLKHIVPFLLNTGMESSVHEVRGYSVFALAKIIQKSPGEDIRPYAPIILEKFLFALSSLEPQEVNYVHLNADKYGLTGQGIDKMRLKAIRNSPLMESIEMHLLDTLDEASMKEAVLHLEHVIRSAVGLPSKVGCSRVLAALSSKTILFQPYADRFLRMVRKYVMDRNETVSASYSNAIGYLTRLGSEEEMLKTIAYAQRTYFDSEDTTHRAVAGEILYSMSKFANDRVNKVFATFLPLVFVGINDTDKEVREFFSKAWNDNVSGSRTVLLYLKEILEIVIVQLDSPQWAIKHGAAFATAKVVESLGKTIDVVTAKAVWPCLEKALSAKTWDGKDKILRAMVEFAKGIKPCLKELGDIESQMKVIAVREAKRNNASYRPDAFKCLGSMAALMDGWRLAPDAIKIVSQAVEEYADASEEKMDIDDHSKAKLSKNEEETFVASVQCLLKCLDPSAPYAVLGEEISQSVPIIETAVKSGGKATHNVLYEGLKGLFNRLSALPADSIKECSNAFSSLASQLLFRDLEIVVEAARIKRAEAADAFAAVCVKGKLEFRQEWKDMLGGWTAAERSGQVKMILDKVTEKTQTMAAPPK